MAFPAISCAPNVIGQAQPFTLLHNMCSFMSSQAQRWLTAKPDPIS
jgi:hypothetical protein